LITVNTISQCKQALGVTPRPIGLIPTMGSLHEGHLSLIRAAKKDCQSVVVSVFVNPSQFGPNEDYQSYPRDIEGDRALLEKEGVDILFAPTATEMYAPGHDTWVEVGSITERLEGKARPGHFRGVATVVLKLFNIVNPDTAYFGQKDAQQALVIKKMVKDLDINTNITVMPTARSQGGLALSSRNHYLSESGRITANAIYESLKLAEDLYEKGQMNAGSIKDRMQDILNNAGVKIDYISIATADTLEELEIINQKALVSLAVYIGTVRLIDNILLG
jgi:pantoate--beta-alanine ligase